MKKICLLFLGMLAGSQLVFGQNCPGVVSTFPYTEGFESGPGNWSAGGANSSWGCGTLAKPSMSYAAAGTKAWATGLTGTHNANEDSYVKSPCFNFTNVNTPVLEMKIWWESEYNWDGTVLQSSIDGGATWQIVGNFGDPNNWYTDDQLHTAPGGQNTFSGIGWSGTNNSQVQGSGTWVTAKHHLTGLGNHPSVMLRFAFASDAQNQDDGFAFDEIKITEGPAKDAGVAAILAPASGCNLTGQDAVTVTVKNFGSTAITNFPVTYKINNGLPVTETFSGTILPNASSDFTFATKANLGATGTYTFESRTLLLNDTITQNDAKTKVVTALPAISNLPYTESFENSNGGWTEGGTNVSWAWGIPAKGAMNHAAAGSKAWVTSLTGNYNSDENSQVESPCFNLSATLAPVIEMKVWWDSEWSYDGAVLQYSTDAGATWQNIGAFGDPNNWFNDNDINAMPGGQTLAAEGWTGTSLLNGSLGWVTVKHRLPNLAGNPSVKFRVAFASDFSTEYEGFAFDNVKIYDSPAKDVGISAIVSPNPACSLSNQETVMVKVTNFGTAAQASIPVSYRLGTAAWITETIPGPLSPDSTVTFSFAAKANLAANGNYTVETRTNLLNDGLKENDSLVSVITNVPTIATFPYFQNFETNGHGWIVGGTGSSWALGTPSKTVINSAASGTHSWTTGLTNGYNASENSWVLSPCFNFSALINPMISMKIWWNSEDHWDGAILQSSIDGGATWQNVGKFGDAYNWFNDNGISSGPGNQIGVADGWSGTAPGLGSGGWVTARNYLQGLAGQSSVKLRIAFASDAAVNDDGFAFDDVLVYEAPANDVGILAIKAPNSSTCGGGTQENVTVALKNYGSVTQTSVPVSFAFTGAGTGNGSGNFTGSLPPGDTILFTFPIKANLSAAGVYAFTATTALTGDTTVSNNVKTKNLTIFNPINTFPYIQDFETGVVGSPGTLPAGWTSDYVFSQWPIYSWDVNAGPTFNQATGPLVDHTSGTATGQYVFANSANGNIGDSTVIYSPCINLSSLTNPGMDFWYHMAGGAVGSLKIDVSTNNGLTWDTITSINGTQTYSSASPWKKKVISLAGYSGTVKVRFRAYSGGMSIGSGGDIALDDIRFFNLPTTDLELLALTLPNSNCGLTATETVCISIKNNGTTSQTNFPVSYTINGGNPVTENCTTSIAPGATVNYCFTTKANLSVAGTYNFSAATALATDGDPLNNTQTGGVTSIPVISTFPYVQGFENGNGGWLAGGTNSSWVIGTPAKTHINSAAAGSNSYVTNLTGTHNRQETSEVVSPCFNFSGMADPDFEMKAWWDCRYGNVGAVLQSSIDGGLTWQLVGAHGDPDNWYNLDFIGSRPGGQSGINAEGWSGNNIIGGSNGWVTVKHRLTGLGGQSSVKLRVAFASGTFVQMDGFAFDEVKIIDNTNNLEVKSFVPLPQQCAYNTNEPVRVVLENLGNTPVSGFTVSYTVDGGAPVTQPFAGQLAPGIPTNFVFGTGANLSAAGSHTVVVTINYPADPVQANNSLSYPVNNAMLSNVLPLALDFETPATDISNLRIVTNTNSAITELPAGSFGAGSTKGLVMDGSPNTGWVPPVGIHTPWNSNPENFSAAYICISPNAATYDDLLLHFDLKQLYKDANSNTSFRVTVNGTQVGPTYQPPFAGTPIVWQPITVNLNAYKNLANIQIGLESNVSEHYNNGSGPANLLDNIVLERKMINGIGKMELEQVRVYPNPSDGIFQVELPTASEPYELQVTDLSGKVILKRNAASGTSALDLTGVAKGIYLLKLTGAKQTAIRKLVVK